jgi:hypothetical protein
MLGKSKRFCKPPAKLTTALSRIATLPIFHDTLLAKVRVIVSNCASPQSAYAERWAAGNQGGSQLDPKVYSAAIDKLRETLVEQDMAQMIEWRDPVIERFQKSFSPGSISDIREEEFRAFLIGKNNHHWSGLQRIGQVTGMGTAVATAILFVAYPTKYGVWNSTSEGGLKALNLWPHFERGESVGERYVKVNQILNKVSSDLGIDLWTLDMLWWSIQNLEPESEPSWSDVQTERLPNENVGDIVRFSLERHLHDFLRDNWQDTSLGREWDIYSEPGEPEKGYEYPCGVGRIDLLARHKTRPDWLIIELKRGQTSDVTVGQLLRYMGWVKSHLSEPHETVYGLIIAHDIDDSLRYALSILPNVSLQLYEVSFHLHPISLPGT